MRHKLFSIVIFLSASYFSYTQNLFLDTDILSGEDIELKELHFLADSSQIEQRSHAMLDELVRFLSKNGKTDIEIRGHTNGIPTHEYCDHLSQARADAVMDYLIEKGISSERLTATGYGKRMPLVLYEDASNRNQNQRVEIRFLE